jgi:hypothetical protein
MPVRRRSFFSGNEPGQTDLGGGERQAPRMSMGGAQSARRVSGGQPPAPPMVPPPTDPMVAAGAGPGRGPMPGNMQRLLVPQQQPGMGGGMDMSEMLGGGDPENDNPMMGSSSVVLRLLQQLGKV